MKPHCDMQINNYIIDRPIFYTIEPWEVQILAYLTVAKTFKIIRCICFEAFLWINFFTSKSPRVNEVLLVNITLMVCMNNPLTDNFFSTLIVF